MKTLRLTRLMAPLVFVVALSNFGAAAPAPDVPVPASGQKAGKITALLPTAHIVRGEGKKAVTTEATRGEDVIWQDLVTTEKGGRARITLTDQSILSLGSQAQLRIVKHDARAQQTTLEMTYGRVRAQVSTVTRDGGSFQLRTPTAVAGVIGTDFGTDASEPGVTTFLCISGLVQVSNTDSAVSGSVPCAAGQTTTVKSGLPPTPPKPATPQQINQLITDTEPATISAFAPASALVGTTLDAVATGTHMTGINGVNITGSGIQVSLGSNAGDTSVTAHLIIAPAAQPGPRTVTFTKPNGANTAAVFTVIVPPGLQGTDAASLKKRYTDILTSELQAADSSNASIKASLQQDIDQGLQTVQQSEAKLTQPVSTDRLTQRLATLVANFAASGSNRETQAYNTASGVIDQIVAAMVSKIQNGTEPTANIAADLDKQFAPINQTFQAALNQIHTDFVAQAATQIQSIDQLVADFSQSINTAAQQQLAPPTPKVDSQERTVEAGFQTSFDAGGSSALAGAGIASTSWVLCDPSYKPAQVGILLPGDAPGCRAVPGFAASGGQFQFNTCALTPADYTARVTVVDTNGKSSAMDVRLHLTQPAYDDPQTRLQSLASAYVSLQSQQFLSFFDPTYSGYTQLQENIRNTFLNLSSMQIHLRVSQANVTCNEATVRADWEQKYTFKGDQTCANAAAGSGCQRVLFTQSEQLTARMTRVPGKGWFVSDFQGDNGTVQGTAPGPQTTFSAQPSLEVTGLQVFAPASSSAQQAQGGHQRATGQQPAVGLAPGVNHFVATVQNIGNAPLTQQPQLRFSLLDANGTEITGDTENLPTLPLNPGDSETVNGSFTVPTLPPATPVSVGANVNPGCKIQEQTCGSKNISFINAVAGTVDLAVAGITATGQYVGTQTGIINVKITNGGTAPSLPGSGNLVLTSPDFPGTLGTADIPSVSAGGSVTVTISFTVPMAPGQHSIKVAITPPAFGDSNPANDSATTSLNFVGGNVDLQIGALSFTQGQPPFAAGETHAVTFTVKNAGNVPSNAADTFSCSLVNGKASAILGTGVVPAIAIGATSPALNLQFVVPAGTQQANFAGTSTVNCMVAPDPLENANQLANNSATIPAFINAPAYAITAIASANSPNPPTGTNAFNVGQSLTLQVTVANTGTASPTGSIVVGFSCTGPSQCAGLPTTTIAAPAAGQSVVANVPAVNLQLPAGTGYVQTATITSAPAQSSTAGNTGTLGFDVIDFTLTNALNLSGDLNVKIGGQGLFNVSLSEPQGPSPVSIPVAAGPTLSGVNYAVVSPFAAGSSNPVVVTASGSAPAGTSALVSITGTRLGVAHSATQSVRFFTASLENFSPGQPGSSQTQPIILPVNGSAQSLSLRLSGNFFNPGGGAQLTFPTVTGISLTPSATVAAAGDVVTVQVAAVQGAPVNQTIPLVFQAQVPNMNPPAPEILTVFVRPTALPDLAITTVTAAGRNFSTNPWLSGEPVDFTVTVTNNGPGASQGFERLHLLLNGQELTGGNVTVPQALAASSSVNVTVHAVAPDPIPTGSSTLVVKVDEDAVGDANPSNDSMSGPVSTSDWTIGIPAPTSPLPNGGGSGSSDSQPLVVPGGTSTSTIIQPMVSSGGAFLTPIAVLNGIVSSRISATPSTSTITSSAPITYTIGAGSNAAAGFYAAQLIARFVDGGHNTAQRQATVHIAVRNANLPGDTVTLTSSQNNACTAANGTIVAPTCGTGRVQINGLLIENLGLTVNRSNPQNTAGSVDLHFTDQSSIISNVGLSGSFQTPIINGVAYGIAKNVLFAAAQDASGAVTPGNAQVIVSATSIQTSAVRDGPTPDFVGPNQTALLFSIGDLQLGSVPCFNVSPGASGNLQLTFTPLGGFNVPSISWSVASLPPGVVLNSVTQSSTPSGGYPVSISLTNTNPSDITPSQPLTLVGTISNTNGTATVAFAPTIQLHAGACVPGAVRNAMIEGGTAGGTRGVWRHGTAAGFIARSNVTRETNVSAADVRLLTGDVSYTPSMPKVGDTIQVRFRLMNSSSADARDVPVALVVNGAIVASDTFDVGPGKTVLAGLQWNNAQLPRWALVNGAVAASVVVDPARNTRAMIASGKTAPLTHFEFAGGGVAGGAPIQSLNGRQRALIELAESACTGFRFSSGAGGACASSDIEISLDDAAAGRFSFTSTRGISDLGLGYNGSGIPAGAQYSPQTVALAGHSYAVQLDGGRVGVLTISAIHNPHQKSATANKVFHGRPTRVLRKMAPTGEPVDTGDVSGTAPSADAVVLDVLYDTP